MSRRVLWLSLVLLAGCGGHGGAAHSSSAPAPELVPFDAAQPEALAAGPVTPAPACRASQLRPSGALQFVPAVQSGGTGGVILRNTGPRPCRLDGRPGVRFVGGTAPPPQRQRPLAAEPLAFPRVAPPASALLALAPGKGAVLSIDWDNWCPRTSTAGRTLRPPKAARVTLPRHGGSLDLDYSAVAPCEHAGRPSQIGVRPFAPQPLDAKGGFSTTPTTAKLHPLDGGKGALHGRRGQELRFAVELRNASRTDAVTFDRCPLVAERFAPVGGTEAHRLNCAGAKPIQPGAARWFEMRVRVPPGAPVGPNGLFWRLDPAGDFAPQAVTRVIVDR